VGGPLRFNPSVSSSSSSGSASDHGEITLDASLPLSTPSTAHSSRTRIFHFFSDFKKRVFALLFFSTDIFSKRRKRSLAKSSVLGSSKWLHNFALVLHFYHLSVIICFNCYGQPPYHGWIAYNNNYYYITCWCAVKKLLLLTHLRRTDWVVSKTTYIFALFSKKSQNVTFYVFGLLHAFSRALL